MSRLRHEANETGMDFEDVLKKIFQLIFIWLCKWANLLSYKKKNIF